MKLKKIICLSFVCLTFNDCFAIITQAQKKDIGMQIWQNEAGKKYDLLVFWNSHEPFPSLGIGHFVWFPANGTYPFKQMFPELLDYLKKRDTKLPMWLELAQKKGAPWATKKDFDKDANGWKAKELRELLYETIDLQVDFFIENLQLAWPRIQAASSKKNVKFIKKHYHALLSTPQGTYALIDYLNFKGEGTNPNEQINKQGWGLLQVLEHMPHIIKKGQEVKEFVKSAKFVLERRVQNSNKVHEINWLVGWNKRLETYLTFNYSN